MLYFALLFSSLLLSSPLFSSLLLSSPLFSSHFFSRLLPPSPVFSLLFSFLFFSFLPFRAISTKFFLRLHVQEPISGFELKRTDVFAFTYIPVPLFPGNYIYIETSYPRRRGDKAWLYSPVYPASVKGKCLNFWYHMYGADIGSLNIYLTTPTGTPLWNRTGNQNNVWRHGRVTLQSNSSFSVSNITSFL